MQILLSCPVSLSSKPVNRARRWTDRGRISFALQKQQESNAVFLLLGDQGALFTYEITEGFSFRPTSSKTFLATLGDTKVKIKFLNKENALQALQTILVAVHFKVMQTGVRSYSIQDIDSISSTEIIQPGSTITIEFGYAPVELERFCTPQEVSMDKKQTVSHSEDLNETATLILKGIEGMNIGATRYIIISSSESDLVVYKVHAISMGPAETKNDLNEQGSQLIAICNQTVQLMQQQQQQTNLLQNQNFQLQAQLQNMEVELQTIKLENIAIREQETSILLQLDDAQEQKPEEVKKWDFAFCKSIIDQTTTIGEIEPLIKMTTNLLSELHRKKAEIQVKQEQKDSGTCCICQDDEKVILFKPCGHICTCIECSSQVTDCPLCRTKIEERIRVFH